MNSNSASLGGFGTIFLICGVYRSGSTWSFNVIREAALRMDLSVYQAAGYPEAEFSRHDVALFKIHHAPAGIMENFWQFEKACKIVITRRAPVDCVGSMMQTFGYSFEVALAEVRRSFDFSALLALERRALIIDYRKIIQSPVEECFKLLCYAFDTGIAQKYLAPVSDATSRLRLAGLSHNLRANDPHTVHMGNTTYYDAKTYLHRRHVNSTDRNYELLLTDQQRRIVANEIQVTPGDSSI